MARTSSDCGTNPKQSPTVSQSMRSPLTSTACATRFVPWSSASRAPNLTGTPARLSRRHAPPASFRLAAPRSAVTGSAATPAASAGRVCANSTPTTQPPARVIWSAISSIRGWVPASSTASPGTSPCALTKACRPPAAITPGRVQPGSGTATSWQPAATSSLRASTRTMPSGPTASTRKPSSAAAIPITECEPRQSTGSAWKAASWAASAG